MVFNTPGANANAVAELVIGMLIAGNAIAVAQWCQGLTGDPAMAKAVEKGKKQFVQRLQGQDAGCHRSGCHRLPHGQLRH